MNEAYELGGEQLRRLALFAELLEQANAEMNLVGDARREVLENRHFRDSLALLPMLREQVPEAKTLIDVGSGAGFPGVPLAIALPEVQVTLLDSLGKRCAFLETAAERLGLRNVTVINARAEEAARGPLRGSFDAAASRAVAKMPMLCELCLPFLGNGGVFFSMKSRHAVEEMAAADRAIRTLGAEPAGQYDYALPPYPGEENGVELTVFAVKKTAETPERYPRAFGAIKKRPL